MKKANYLNSVQSDRITSENSSSILMFQPVSRGKYRWWPKALAFAVFLLFMIGSFTQLMGATYTSVASGNWNADATWSGTGTPVAGDIVNIANGHTITVTANAACASITFTGAAATLTVNNTFTLTASGSLTLNSASANNTACIISGAGSFSCASVQVGTDGTPAGFTTLTTIMTESLSAFNVSGNLTISSFIGTSTNRIINSTFNIGSGTMNIDGTITTTNENGVNTSTFSMATGAQSGTLQLSNASPFNITGTGTSTITLNGTSSLVNYDASGTQTVRAAAYTNLTLSGTSAKTTTSVTVNGILSMEGDGTVSASATLTYGSGATLQFKGNAAKTTGNEFPSTFAGTGGVRIDNSNGVTLGAAKTITYLLTMTSGTLNMANTNLTIGSLTGSGNLTHSSGTAGARTLTIGSDGTSPAAYSGVISNGTATSVAVTKSGTGTLTLSGDNTYTGATTINAGTLKLGSSTALGAVAGNTVIASGAVLDMNGQSVGNEELEIQGTGISSAGALINSSGTAASLSGDINNTLSDAGVYSVGGSSDITLTGNVQGRITKVSTNILTLSGTVDNVGLGITVNAGSVVLAKASNGGVHSLGGAGFTVSGGTLKLGGSGGDQIYDFTGNTIINSGTFDLNGQNETISAFIGSGGTILNNGGSASTLTAGIDNSSKTYSGIIANGSSGAGGMSLVKVGTGIQTLSGINTYSGTTTVNGGTLKAGVVTQAFGVGSAVTLANTAGVVLDITGYSNTIGSLTGGGGTGGNVTLGTTATLTVGSDNTSPAAFAGVISGTGGALTKTGNGTLTLSGANTFTGLTTVNGGILEYGVNNALSNGAVTISGGSLDILTFSDAVGAVTLTSGSIDGTSGVLTGTSYTMQSGSVSAILAGAIGLSKTTTGTVILSGANTYTGLTTISAGTLKLGADGGTINTPLGTTGAGTTVTSGAALDLNGFTLGTNEALTLNGTGISNGGALMNSGTAATYSGLITLGSASSIVGGTGTISISNAGTITGATFGLTLGGAQGGTLSSILGTTSGTLTKADAGTWTLSGASTYTGITTISAGTIKLGAAGSGANSPLGVIGGLTSVTSGAALDLNGITLVTAEPLTLNGTGISGSGALTNNSATAASYSGLITLGSTGVSIEANAGNINITNASTITGATFGLTLGGAQGGTLTSILGTTSGTLTKADAGTWTLSGANTYTGATTISAGTLKLGAAERIANTSTLTVTGTFDLAGFSETVAALSGAGIVTSTAAGTLTLTVGDASNTSFSGVIQNGSATSVSFSKAGAGILTLSGNNAYTGTTTINAGAIQLGAADVLPNYAITLNGGTLSTGSGAGFSETIGAITLSATSTIALGTGVHTLTIANSSTATWGAFTLNINGWTGLGGAGGTATAGKIMVGAGG
ncbi:MAG: beta strand repeat-containing protein, partial [Bacteroidales bacterium]